MQKDPEIIPASSVSNMQSAWHNFVHLCRCTHDASALYTHELRPRKQSRWGEKQESQHLIIQAFCVPTLFELLGR